MIGMITFGNILKHTNYEQSTTTLQENRTDFTERFLIIAIGLLIFSFQITAGVKANRAPEFILPEANSNQNVSLADLRGRVVYMVFWSSSCPECQESLNAASRFLDRFSDNDFSMIIINLDKTPNLPLPLSNTLKSNVIIAHDADKTVPSLFKTQDLTNSYLIDKSGDIRFEHLGPTKSFLTIIEQEIEQLIEE